MRQYIQDSAWTYLVCYHRYIYVHLHRPWKQCTLFSFMVKHNNWSKEINKITEANSQTGLSNQCYFDGGKSIGSIKLQWGWFCLGFFLVYCQAREDKEKGKADCFFKEESKIKKKNLWERNRKEKSMYLIFRKDEMKNDQMKFCFHLLLWLKLFAEAVFSDLIAPKLHSWQLFYFSKKANRNWPSFKHWRLPLTCLLENHSLEVLWFSVVMLQCLVYVGIHVLRLQLC